MLGRYCVLDGMPPSYIYHSLSDAVAQYLRSQDIPTSAWLDDFGCRNPGPHATSARPAKEGNPRSGGPRTHDLLPVRLLYGLSKMLTGTHHRPGLPWRRLRHGATQLLHAWGQTVETRDDPTGHNWQPKYIAQPTKETNREVYEYVRSGTTGQPAHAPHVPPDSCN